MTRPTSMTRPGRPAHDLTGRTFARLTVLHMAPANGGSSRAVCRCECGTRVVVRSYHLLRDLTRSCGCLRREQAPRNRRPSRAATGGYHARMAIIDSILGTQPDTMHVDRPGARLVRGGRY